MPVEEVNEPAGFVPVIVVVTAGQRSNYKEPLLRQCYLPDRLREP